MRRASDGERRAHRGRGQRPGERARSRAAQGADAVLPALEDVHLHRLQGPRARRQRRHRGQVRVLIESGDEHERWGTVGVSHERHRGELAGARRRHRVQALHDQKRAGAGRSAGDRSEDRMSERPPQPPDGWPPPSGRGFARTCRRTSSAIPRRARVWRSCSPIRAFTRCCSTAPLTGAGPRCLGPRARFVSHLGRFLTGIEIHPGAKFGRRSSSITAWAW